MKPEIDPELRRFLLTSVPSVPYLEALLLLRSDAHAHWQPSSLAARLYLPERRAAELLAQLAQAGVASGDEEGGFRYAPGAELAVLLDRVSLAYASDLVGITDLIHSRIDKRAHQFADAFRLRKDNNP